MAGNFFISGIEVDTKRVRIIQTSRARNLAVSLHLLACLSIDGLFRIQSDIGTKGEAVFRRQCGHLRRFVIAHGRFDRHWPVPYIVVQCSTV